MYASMHVYMYERMYICMYVCMNALMYVQVTTFYIAFKDIKIVNCK